MPCYHPLKGWHQAGTKAITFKYNDSIGVPMSVPCGQCLGCRMEKSRQWAMRCMHEASLYDENSFITLTYAPENLPKNNTLKKAHFQKFMKRLRKQNKNKIRYYHCGEYGETNLRPHYHAILFNKDFPDKTLLNNKKDLFISEELQTAWPAGFSTIGSVSFESAAYVSRYILKKQTGRLAQRINPKTGLRTYERYISENNKITNNKSDPIETVISEYTTMSRRPGIARDWIEKYKDDVYPSDNIHLNGVSMRPPKYYDNVVYEHYPSVIEEIKNARMENFDQSDNTPERLAVKKKVAQARMSNYKRNL